MIVIGNDWDERLAGEWDKPYYEELRSFLIEEYRDETVYPPADEIYTALRQTPYAKVKVVILGQDPYHEPGQAHGLAFSVHRDVPSPPSLINILKELETDLGVKVAPAKVANGGASHAASDATRIQEDDGVREASEEDAGEDAAQGGILTPWAKQGVLLLNTVLTVRAHAAGSHRGKGWEIFTDRIIELLAMREEPLVFILWGANAGAKYDLIRRTEQGSVAANDGTYRHLIIRAPHPSPLSAYRGFFGGRYFSRANNFLESCHLQGVDWRL